MSEMYLPSIKFGFCVLVLGRTQQLEDHSQSEDTTHFPGKIISYFILLALVENLQGLWGSWLCTVLKEYVFNTS